jgi:hypothetical protein
MGEDVSEVSKGAFFEGLEAIGSSSGVGDIDVLCGLLVAVVGVLGWVATKPSKFVRPIRSRSTEVA